MGEPISIVIVAIICLTFFASWALYLGYDHALAMAVISVIAGLAGYEVKTVRVRRKAKT